MSNIFELTEILGLRLTIKALEDAREHSTAVEAEGAAFKGRKGTVPKSVQNPSQAERQWAEQQDAFPALKDILGSAELAVQVILFDREKNREAEEKDIVRKQKRLDLKVAPEDAVELVHFVDYLNASRKQRERARAEKGITVPLKFKGETDREFIDRCRKLEYKGWAGGSDEPDRIAAIKAKGRRTPEQLEGLPEEDRWEDKWPGVSKPPTEAQIHDAKNHPDYQAALEAMGGNINGAIAVILDVMAQGKSYEGLWGDQKMTDAKPPSDADETSLKAKAKLAKARLGQRQRLAKVKQTPAELEAEMAKMRRGE